MLASDRKVVNGIRNVGSAAGNSRGIVRVMDNWSG